MFKDTGIGGASMRVGDRWRNGEAGRRSRRLTAGGGGRQVRRWVFRVMRGASARVNMLSRRRPYAAGGVQNAEWRAAVGAGRCGACLIKDPRVGVCTAASPL